MTAEKGYFYANAENRPVGPVSIEQLRALASAGEITNRTPVIVEGESLWRRMGDVDRAGSGLGESAVAAAAAGGGPAWVGTAAQTCRGFGIGTLEVFRAPWRQLAEACEVLRSTAKTGRLAPPSSRFMALDLAANRARPALVLGLPALAFGAAAARTLGIAGTLGVWRTLVSLALAALAAYLLVWVVAIALDLASALLSIAEDLSAMRRE